MLQSELINPAEETQLQLLKHWSVLIDESLNLGDLRTALALLRRVRIFVKTIVTQLNPSILNEVLIIHNNIGNAQVEQGKFSLALEIYNQVSKMVAKSEFRKQEQSIQNQALIAYSNIIAINFQLGRYTSALRTHAYLISQVRGGADNLSPKSIDILILTARNVVLSLSQRKEYSQALKIYSEFIKVLGDYVQSAPNTGTVETLIELHLYAALSAETIDDTIQATALHTEFTRIGTASFEFFSKDYQEFFLSFLFSIHFYQLQFGSIKLAEEFLNSAIKLCHPKFEKLSTHLREKALSSLIEHFQAGQIDVVDKIIDLAFRIKKFDSLPEHLKEPILHCCVKAGNVRKSLDDKVGALDLYQFATNLIDSTVGPEYQFEPLLEAHFYIGEISLELEKIENAIHSFFEVIFPAEERLDLISEKKQRLIIAALSRVCLLSAGIRNNGYVTSSPQNIFEYDVGKLDLHVLSGKNQISQHISDNRLIHSYQVLRDNSRWSSAFGKVLTPSRFYRWPRDIQVLLLNTLTIAGLAYDLKEESFAAFEMHNMALGLGREIFEDLPRRSQEYVLISLCSAIRIHMQNGEENLILKISVLLFKVGVREFQHWSQTTQEGILVELLNVTALYFNRGNLDSATDSINHATNLSSLSPERWSISITERILDFLLKLGESYLSKEENDQALHLIHRAGQIALQTFEELPYDFQTKILLLLIDAGQINRHTERGLQILNQAIQLGIRTFNLWPVSTQEALLFAISICGEIQAASNQRALARKNYELITSLGAPLFGASELIRTRFLLALLNLTILQETVSSEMILFCALSPFNPDLQVKKSDAIRKSLIDIKTNPYLEKKIHLFDQTLIAARYWICKLDAFPVKPARYAQSQSLKILTEAFVAEIQCLTEQKVAAIESLTQVEFFSDRHDYSLICKCVARTFCELHHWPTRFENAGEWLLALLWSIDKKLCVNFVDQLSVQDSHAAFHAILSMNPFLESGQVRAPTSWIQSFLDSWRLESSLQDGSAFDSILKKWRDRDDTLAKEVLLQAWEVKLEQMNESDRYSNTIGLPFVALEQLLQRLEVDNPRAVAKNAFICANVDNVLADALDNWITNNLLSVQKRQHKISIDAVLQSLISHTERTEDELKILSTFHQYSRFFINSIAAKPIEIWRDLEISRVSLCTSSQAFGASSSMKRDDSATHVLYDAVHRTIIKSVALTQPLEDNQKLLIPLNEDSPVQPFSTLGSELQRLGYRLTDITVQTAVEHLEPNESLFQLWWDDLGEAHGLLLSQTEELISVELPKEFNQTNFEALLTQWKILVEPISINSSVEGRLQNFEIAWEELIAENSKAVRLLKWLFDTGQRNDKECRLVVILPENLAHLPWLALVNNFEHTNFSITGQLELAVSVSAWVNSRHEMKSNENFVQPSVPDQFGNIVLDHEDDLFKPGTFGHTEALYVSRYFGTDVKLTFGLSNLIQSLQAPGPVHLLMHGIFDSDNPSNSSLNVTKNGQTIRAGSLIGLKVRGDISLASCSAMMMSAGATESRFLGPTGIGAVLSAAGARSVVGALWEATPITSFIFYYIWFDERRSKTAADALKSTQRRMRNLDFRQFEKIIFETAPRHLRAQASTHAMHAMSQKWSGPFAHPWCFAGYTLLGDSQPLPELKKIRPWPKLLYWVIHFIEKLRDAFKL